MFFNSKTLIALGFASLVVADSDTFGLIVIRSGSQYQYSSISVSNGEFIAGTDGTVVEAVITDDGKLKLADGSYAVVGDSGITSGTEGSSPFSITSRYLQYAGSSGFSIEGGKLVAGSGSNPVALSPRTSDGQVAADFSPSGSGSGSGSSSSSVAASSSSAVVETQSANSTVSTASAPTFVTQTENGAVMKGVSYGAAFVAAGALLI